MSAGTHLRRNTTTRVPADTWEDAHFPDDSSPSGAEESTHFSGEVLTSGDRRPLVTGACQRPEATSATGGCARDRRAPATEIHVANPLAPRILRPPSPASCGSHRAVRADRCARRALDREDRGPLGIGVQHLTTAFTHDDQVLYANAHLSRQIDARLYGEALARADRLVVR